MKKILFVCYGLGIGGIEKCLVNLLNQLSEDKYSVDVLLMNSHYDLLISQINRNVKILDDFEYVMNTEKTLSNIRSRKGILHNFAKFIRYCVFRVYTKLGINPIILFKSLPNKYDVAVAYSHHDYSPKYVIDKVNADRKVLWYHNGTYEKSGKAFERDNKYFNKFDYVVAVSSDCAKVLENKFAFSKKKLIVLRNICDIESIVTRAQEFIPNEFAGSAINIVTVGRLTPEKGADLAVEACKLLLDEGYNVCWHWIGDGNQIEIMREKVSLANIENNFIFEGNQDNPYPYINNADVYVQTSYYEAYSTTITEAKVLCKPIVTTDVGGMRDQITHDMNGLITSVDATEVAKAIKILLEDTDKRNSFIAELKRDRSSFHNSLKEYEDTVFL